LQLRSRVWQRLEELGEIGADPAGGVTRLALTPEERAATALVRRWMEEAGMETRIDGVGNLVGTYPGRDRSLPAVATGSHLDTVPNGGRYDGALGVVAGVECVQRFSELGLTFPRDIQVVAFVGEEPSRFPGFVGSQALVGRLGEVSAVRSLQGETLAEALAACGLDPEEAGKTRWRPLRAFLELHIEQGRVLEDAGVPVGIVTAIAGLRILECTLVGLADHAGATPMPVRKDALCAGAEVVLAVERIARSFGDDAVATVGKLEVRPGGANVIPGLVRLSVDLRHTDARRLDALYRQVQQTIEEVQRRRGVSGTTRTLLAVEPVPVDAELTSLLCGICEERHLDFRLLPSGAGHDSQNIAALGPIAMIFVRTRQGISHSPDEYASPSDIEQGVEVLYEALRLLAAET
jgi:allantoate deiminase